MENLGIQPIQLLAQVFNFLILLFVLKKFLYKPILKALEDRKKKIQEGLSFSESMKKEKEELEKKKTEILEEAKKEAQKIIADAKKQSKKNEALILEEAQKQAQKILEKGKKDLENLKSELYRDMQGNSVELAGKMVEKILAGAFSEQEHHALVNKMIKDLQRP